jgi:hypothetical protein
MDCVVETASLTYTRKCSVIRRLSVDISGRDVLSRHILNAYVKWCFVSRLFVFGCWNFPAEGLERVLSVHNDRGLADETERLSSPCCVTCKVGASACCARVFIGQTPTNL